MILCMEKVMHANTYTALTFEDNKCFTTDFNIMLTLVWCDANADVDFIYNNILDGSRIKWIKVCFVQRTIFWASIFEYYFWCIIFGACFLAKLFKGEKFLLFFPKSSIKRFMQIYYNKGLRKTRRNHLYFWKKNSFSIYSQGGEFIEILVKKIF